MCIYRQNKKFKKSVSTLENASCTVFITQHSAVCLSNRMAFEQSTGYKGRILVSLFSFTEGPVCHTCSDWHNYVELTKVVIHLLYQVVLWRPWAAQLSWHTDLEGWWPAHTGDCWSLWGRHRTLHLRGFQQSRSRQHLCWGLHWRSDVFTSGNYYIFFKAFI